MVPFLFTRAILEGRLIDVFNHGRMQCAFTYVDDIVEAVVRVNHRVPPPDFAYTPPTSIRRPVMHRTGCSTLAIINHQSVPLMDFICCLEERLGRQAKKRLLPMQLGDMAATYADTSALKTMDRLCAEHAAVQALRALSIGIATTTSSERKVLIP